MSMLVNIFAALADPTRLRILTLLRSMELSVGELAQVLGQSQPRVSRHLKILADVGLVDRRKEGAWTFVGLGPEDRAKPALAALYQIGGSASGERVCRYVSNCVDAESYIKKKKN